MRCLFSQAAAELVDTRAAAHVFLASLSKQAPGARVIVLASKEQVQSVPLLAERFPLHAVLTLPVTVADVDAVLRA